MKPFALCGMLFFACTFTAGAASAQVTQTYSYDAHGRLIEVTTSGPGGTNTAVYAYDQANNRTQRVRSGTTSYAALESLPDGGLLSPNEALVSPDGRYALALRQNGQLELWREDDRLWSVEDLPDLPLVVSTSSGSVLALAAGQAEAAVWSVTNDGLLVATTGNGMTTLWSSEAVSL